MKRLAVLLVIFAIGAAIVAAVFSGRLAYERDVEAVISFCRDLAIELNVPVDETECSLTWADLTLGEYGLRLSAECSLAVVKPSAVLDEQPIQHHELGKGCPLKAAKHDVSSQNS